MCVFVCVCTCRWSDNEPEVKQPSADDDSINAIAVVVGVVAAAIIAVLIIVVIILLRQIRKHQAMLDRKRAAHAQSKVLHHSWSLLLLSYKLIMLG